MLTNRKIKRTMNNIKNINKLKYGSYRQTVAERAKRAPLPVHLSSWVSVQLSITVWDCCLWVHAWGGGSSLFTANWAKSLTGKAWNPAASQHLLCVRVCVCYSCSHKRILFTSVIKMGPVSLPHQQASSHNIQGLEEDDSQILVQLVNF